MPCLSEMNEVPYDEKCHFINIGLTEDWSVLIVHQSTNQIHVNDRCMLKCWHLKMVEFTLKLKCISDMYIIQIF